MKKYAEYARRLKLAMSEAGLSQKDLSARTGIGKSSLSQYMNGLNWPDDNRKVGQIAEILNVNPAWLMGFDAQMQTEDDQPVVKSAHHGWYTDPETAKVAQEIFDDRDLHALQMRLISSNIKGFIELLEQVLEQMKGGGITPTPFSTRQQR